MKLFVRDEKGIYIEVENVKSIGRGDIIVRLKRVCREEAIEEMEKYLSNKFGRKVILLDGRYGEILTLPPENDAGAAGGRP